MADSKKPTRDVDDISLDDARPSGKSGKGGAVLVLILLIAAVALIWFISAQQHKKAAEVAKAKADAAVAREAQISKAVENLQLATDKAAAGDIDGAIDKLQVADAMLGNVITAANNDGDQDAASAVMAQRAPLSAALSALEAKQAELKAIAEEQFGILRSQFSLTAPAATETPATTTPEGTTPPAEGTAPPAEGAAPAPPPVEGAVPPATPPAEGTAPPAVAPPVPAPAS
jgi:hypothetical protein